MKHFVKTDVSLMERISVLILFIKRKQTGIHLHTLVSLYKSGVQGGIHYTDMFS